MTDDGSTIMADNIRRARRALNMSQARLAELMTEAGYPMHPQTITKVEAGARDIRFAEGIAMARILSITIGDLVGTGTGWEEASRLVARIQEGYQEIQEATRSFRANQERLRKLVPENASTQMYKALSLDALDAVKLGMESD